MPRVRPPEPITAAHELDTFSNGAHPSLDAWLKERTRASEGLSARTSVVCAAEPRGRVVAYYAIATAMAQRVALPSAKLQRGMPDLVPLLLLARLAVDRQYRGIGLGTDLLVDALSRCVAVAELAGVRAVITHAIDETAAAFYAHHGFVSSPLGERVLLMPIELARTLVK